MYFIIGDIHGCASKLTKLYNKICSRISSEDQLIFLGDYIDRGEDSYAVLEILRRISLCHRTHFLTGNHEKMLYDYISGKEDPGMYHLNGGGKTIDSYKKALGSFYIPEEHRAILFNRNYYYETDSFFAVHAGVDPFYGDNYSSTSPFDMVWIREKFYNSDCCFKKTIIFAHTPTQYFKVRLGEVFTDDKRNIIGIDTAAVYGGKLTCLIWPKMQFIQS